MSSEILKDRTQEGKVGKEKKERKKDRWEYQISKHICDKDTGILTLTHTIRRLLAYVSVYFPHFCVPGSVCLFCLLCLTGAAVVHSPPTCLASALSYQTTYNVIHMKKSCSFTTVHSDHKSARQDKPQEKNK